MSREKGQELFRALNTLLDAVTALNLKDLEAEAAADRGETSAQGAAAPSKGKDKVPNPDWEDVPFQPVPITPLSSRPRFSQVVGESIEIPIRTPSSLAVAALAAMANPPPAGGNPAQPGANPPQQNPPLAYNTGVQFTAQWDACQTDQARNALEQEAITSPFQDVQVAAMLKINQRLTATVGQLTNQVQAAHAVAHAAGNVDRFRPAAPPKFGNKAKDSDVRQWLPVIEDYLRNAPDQDFIRLASSYLEGGPRSLWTTVYEAYRVAHGNAEPPNPRQFFRQTMERNYGLEDLEQKRWDTWASLRQGPNQDINEYNVSFQQACTDLAASITDEQVKIEKYRLGLQYDLRELCRASPAGARWQTLQELIQYATLQWPVIRERLARKKKQPSTEATKVGGKRKASGGAGGSGSKRSARLGASGSLSDEQMKKDLAEGLCHKCHLPGHIARDCGPNHKVKKAGKGKAKVAAASGSVPPAEEEEEDF